MSWNPDGICACSSSVEMSGDPTLDGLDLSVQPKRKRGMCTSSAEFHFRSSSSVLVRFDTYFRPKTAIAAAAQDNMIAEGRSVAFERKNSQKKPKKTIRKTERATVVGDMEFHPEKVISGPCQRRSKGCVGSVCLHLVATRSGRRNSGNRLYPNCVAVIPECI